MRKRMLVTLLLAGIVCLVLATQLAAVTPEEAAQLKTTLTPFGAEKAGNSDGTIPAWTGGFTTPIPGFKNGGRRPDPFANEKPVFSINAQNMDKYADKLTDGTKAMLKKYPNSYRLDIYPTHRTSAAPAWVYDNTFKNATRAKLIKGPAGPMPVGMYGGIPFPIPKDGAEVMWNHLLRWRPASWHWHQHGILITSDGKRILTVDGAAEQQMPYYFRDGSPEKFDGRYWFIRLVNDGPPIRAGEAIVGHESVDDTKTQSWVYLTGQRRTRLLPNPCCDTPTPASAGIMGFDDIEVWSTGWLGRFDWKILGKKEIYIPYNSNRSWIPTKDSDLVGAHHLNPDWVRWELHRVWVVEADLAKGQRHQVHKSIYYVDEDSWWAVLGDRWDASGRLWKIDWLLPMAAPDLPGVIEQTHGFYDLVSNTWYANGVLNEMPEQYKITSRWPDTMFTPESMAGGSAR